MNTASNGSTPLKRKSRYHPVFGETLTKELLFRAKIELNETEENIKLGIEDMKRRIENENLPLEMDDILIKFLRVKKYDFEASFESYKTHLRLLDMCVNRLNSPGFETFMYAAQMNLGSVLPFRDEDGKAIILYRTGSYRKVGLQPDDAFCILLALGSCVMSNPATQIAGVAIIIDSKEMRFTDLASAFGYMRMLLPLLEGFPARVRRIDIINERAFFGRLLNLVGPIMPGKLRNRLTCHGRNYESLLQHYPASIMPTEYGGTLGSLDNEHLMSHIEKAYRIFQGDVTKIKTGSLKTTYETDSD